MTFHPLIIALHVASLLMIFMILYSSFFGLRILRKWDLESGSELQLVLERRTYLVSSFLSLFFVAHLLSLFLYIFTADRLHTFFVGAMCAAGSLYAGAFGYPTLVLKIVNFLLAGLWLILNHVDNKAADYPLTRKKYVLLLVMAPFILVEAGLQAAFLAALKPDIITSCCGSLFNASGSGPVAGLSALPGRPMELLFYSTAFVTVGSGIFFHMRGKGSYMFSLMSGAMLVVSVLSIVSFISLYFYELPSHHCPFCLLQADYHYVGYVLYITLLGGAVSGIGVGALSHFRGIASLSKAVPAAQRTLALTAVILFSIFTVIATVGILASNLILFTSPLS